MKINEFEFRCSSSSDLNRTILQSVVNTQCSIYMERLQDVISLRAADTSGESSYCLGGVGLVKKIRAVGSFFFFFFRAVGSLKKLNLVKACDPQMTCVLSSFVLDMTYIKSKYSLYFRYCSFPFFAFCVDFQFYRLKPVTSAFFFASVKAKSE